MAFGTQARYFCSRSVANVVSFAKCEKDPSFTIFTTPQGADCDGSADTQGKGRPKVFTFVRSESDPLSLARGVALSVGGAEYFGLDIYTNSKSIWASFVVHVVQTL